MNKDHCPVCLESFTSAESKTGQRRPKPFDFSVCDHCGALLRFNGNMQPTEATDADWAALTPANRITVENLQCGIRGMKKVVMVVSAKATL